jgi:hypothetical protein
VLKMLLMNEFRMAMALLEILYQYQVFLNSTQAPIDAGALLVVGTGVDAILMSSQVSQRVKRPDS